MSNTSETLRRLFNNPTKYNEYLGKELSKGGGGTPPGYDPATWNSTHTTVNSNSASWGTGGGGGDLSEVAAASGGWNSTETPVNTNRAIWLDHFNSSLIASASGGWNSTQTTVNVNSATWANHSDLTEIASASAGWNSTQSTVNSNSATWDDQFNSTELAGASGGWNSTQTTVNTNSAIWGQTYGTKYVNLTGDTMTGNLNISASDPEFTLTNASDSNYARIVKTDIVNQMTIQNIVQQPASQGFALETDGVDERIYSTDINKTVLTSNGNNFTISYWVKRLSTDQDGILSMGAYNQPWIYGNLNNTTLQYYVNAGYNITVLGVAVNDWHLITLTYDNTTWTCYVDDKIPVTYTGAVGTLPASDFMLGYGFTGYAEAIFDDAVFWTRALEASEVAELYNSGNGIYVSTDKTFSSTGNSMGLNMLALWHFDEGDGTAVCQDSSGNNRIATTQNMQVDSAVTGKISPDGTDELADLITSIDGSGPGEKGILTVGDDEGKTIVNGKTVHVNIDGTEVAQFTSGGKLDVENHNIINALDPISAQHVATKNYVDINKFDSTEIQTASGGWNSTETTVNSNSAAWNTFSSKNATLGCTFNGLGSALAVGLNAYLTIPYDCTIQNWYLISNVVGDLVIDVWKDEWDNFPPAVEDSIAGSEKPTLVAQRNNRDLNLTTWTTNVSTGDVMLFRVDSCNTITQATLTIGVEKA